jgi:hypothetical protein
VPTTIGAPLAICSSAGAGLALELAGQPGDFDAQRFEPALEGDEVLLGEDLGGRHQRDLITGLQRLQRGQGGNHGLAGADVALYQAHHRFVLAEVVGDFVATRCWAPVGLEAQVGQVLRRQARGLGQHRCTQAAQAFAQALLGQLMGQQLFEGQAVLGPVLAFGKFIDVGVGRWIVQVADGVVSGANW